MATGIRKINEQMRDRNQESAERIRNDKVAKNIATKKSREQYHLKKSQAAARDRVETSKKAQEMFKERLKDTSKKKH